ncbi:MAG: aspartyl/glutamyl-tRNA amidotransferase subunit B [Eubacterium sp.]|nr:aspartyl/glutamyl-tRNA amidotransferase subunit B [Eubacterium sp.]
MSFETIIGLEIHVELLTDSKIFCACSTDFGAVPNLNTCPVCLGLPGALPVLNRRVLDHAIAIGLALNCEINREYRFDRKNYFYPDNPQNYQISQLYSPIGVNGHVFLNGSESETETDKTKITDNGINNPRIIRIHEIHMEEDAGKLIHDDETGETLIDYNRAGVPLIEIVTEPDMRNADDVIDFLTNLRTMLIYLGVSDCKMNEGSLRVDVNLSVRPIDRDFELSEDKSSARAGINDKTESDIKKGYSNNQTKTPDNSSYYGDEYGPFGTRTEMKNLNSFKAISRAIANERDRQIKIIENGGEITQETRRWDDEKGVSFTMRSKEDAQDYRYFPDPDLPLIIVSDEKIREIENNLPEMPQARAERYRRDYQLPDYDIGILINDKPLAELFEKTVSLGAEPKQVSNWLMGETVRLMKEKELTSEQLTLNPQGLNDLIELTQAGTINSTTAKDVFAVLFNENIDVKKYVEERGLSMVRDTAQIETLIKKVIAENPQSVTDYRSGKKKAIGFLIGQAMKETRGQADPELVRELLMKLL